MTAEPGPAGTPERSKVRHLAGFLASGTLAFLVDAAVLLAGVHLLGLDPRAARLAAIAVAMVVAWLAHRRLTFAVPTAPTLAELGRYAAAAWTAAFINYATFALLLFARPGTPPLAALVASTAVSTIFSYIAMRYGVFRRPRTGTGGRRRT